MSNKGRPRLYPIVPRTFKDRYLDEFLDMCRSVTDLFVVWRDEGESVIHDEIRKLVKSYADKPFYLNKQNSWGAGSDETGLTRVTEAGLKRQMLACAKDTKLSQEERTAILMELGSQLADIQIKKAMEQAQ